MALVEVLLPAMGEGIIEATLISWLKNEGDTVSIDENLIEVATDKVNSEVPSTVVGILHQKLFEENDVISVGKPFAIVSAGGDTAPVPEKKEEKMVEVQEPKIEKMVQEEVAKIEQTISPTNINLSNSEDRFYSPLVMNIAREEGISQVELDHIQGSGQAGRVTKDDILQYIQNRKSSKTVVENKSAQTPNPGLNEEVKTQKQELKSEAPVDFGPNVEVQKMDRMRKLISGYMMASINTSAHVQSFIEVDVTNIWKWREKNKNAFEKREGEKLTFTPIFMEAVAKALKDFPGMNISVDGEYIIKKKNINLGMAAALPNGNLIVPVIKNADQLNLVGMAKAVNDLGNRAKEGKLKPDDTQGGTYTVTNVGTFGSVFGTPIINQPQVGILALGVIRKVPAVIETPEGDFIGIRQKMFLSHSYDHRVVDGALGGNFVKRVADYLEAFDVDSDF